VNVPQSQLALFSPLPTVNSPSLGCQFTPHLLAEEEILLHGSVQGQVGWSSEQPGLVEGVPAHGRGVGTR